MTSFAWECPRCKRINAPFNMACFCKVEDTFSSAACTKNFSTDDFRCKTCGNVHGSWNGQTVNCSLLKINE